MVSVTIDKFGRCGWLTLHGSICRTGWVMGSRGKFITIFYNYICRKMKNTTKQSFENNWVIEERSNTKNDCFRGAQNWCSTFGKLGTQFIKYEYMQQSLAESPYPPHHLLIHVSIFHRSRSLFNKTASSTPSIDALIENVFRHLHQHRARS